MEVKRLAILFAVLLAPLGYGQDVNTDVLTVETTADSAEYAPGSQPVADPLEACPANTFKWDGEKYVCIAVDRAKTLLAMRDANFDQFRACMSRFGVARMIEDGKVKCRELGKVFDADTVGCAGALPAKEKKE